MKDIIFPQAVRLFIRHGSLLAKTSQVVDAGTHATVGQIIGLSFDHRVREAVQTFIQGDTKEYYVLATANETGLSYEELKEGNNKLSSNQIKTIRLELEEKIAGIEKTLAMRQAQLTQLEGDCSHPDVKSGREYDFTWNDCPDCGKTWSTR